MDALDAFVEARVEAQRAAGKEFTPEQIEKIKAQVRSMVANPDVQKIAAAVKDPKGEVAKEFLKMNLTLGMPGALALIKAVIWNCPGLSPKKRRKIYDNLAIPESLNRSEFGALTVTPRAGSEYVYHLQSGPADHDHNLGRQLDPLLALLTEEEQQTVRDQLGHILYFVRMAFQEILLANVDTFEKLKFELGEDLISIHVDAAASTLYVGPKSGAAKWEPCAGLFIRRTKASGAKAPSS